MSIPFDPLSQLAFMPLVYQPQNGQVNGILSLHKSTFEQAGVEYEPQKDITVIHKKHRYLRYDYIDKDFHHFTGREMCEKQAIDERKELDSYMELYDEILYYYSTTCAGESCAQLVVLNYSVIGSHIHGCPMHQIGPWDQKKQQPPNQWSSCVKMICWMFPFPPKK